MAQSEVRRSADDTFPFRNSGKLLLHEASELFTIDFAKDGFGAKQVLLLYSMLKEAPWRNGMC